MRYGLGGLRTSTNVTSAAASDVDAVRECRRTDELMDLRMLVNDGTLVHVRSADCTTEPGLVVNEACTSQGPAERRFRCC